MLDRLFPLVVLLVSAWYVFGAAEHAKRGQPSHPLVGKPSENAAYSFYAAVACYVFAGAFLLLNAKVFAVIVAIVGLLAALAGWVFARKG